jgi:excisionase family DNA binding protein
MLTVAEVAAYLKVSQPTARRWCARKKLPAFKIGREWRIDKKELDRVIQRLSHVMDEA